MRVEKSSHYAVAAITDVALRYQRGPVALPALSVRLGLSLSHLELVFSALRRAGLVKSVRGPGGGYLLAKGARDITIADIAWATAPGRLNRNGEGGDALTTVQGALTQDLSDALQAEVERFLQSICLADLVEQHLLAGFVLEQAPKPPHQPLKEHLPPKRQLPGEGVPNSVFALGKLVATGV